MNFVGWQTFRRGIKRGTKQVVDQTLPQVLPQVLANGLSANGNLRVILEEAVERASYNILNETQDREVEDDDSKYDQD